ncbi:MAG: DMT family transporter [Paracoccaceae bacterium]
MTSKPDMHFETQKTGSQGVKVLLLLVGIMALYAASWVWSGQVLTEAPPLWAVVIRLSASLAVILLVNHFNRSDTASETHDGPTLPQTLVLSALGFAGFFCFTYFALQSIPPSLLVLVLSGIPILTFLQGALFFGAPLAALSIAGTVLIAGATALFAMRLGVDGTTMTANDSLIGIGYGVLAAIGYSFYGLLYKKWAVSAPVVRLLPRLIAPSIIGIVMIALVFEGSPLNISVRTILELIVIGAILAAPVYMMYNTLILISGPLAASSISVCAPISTFLLDTLVSEQRGLTMIDFALVLAASVGVVLLVLFNQPKAKTS